MALAVILRSTRKSVAVQSFCLQHLVKNVPSIACTNEFTTLSHKKTPLVQGAPMLMMPSRQMSEDHSKLWPIEKAFSVALIGLIPAAIAVPNVVLDNLAAVAAVIHFHWGLEACVVDYIRPIIFGNAIPKLALGLLYFISAATLGGLIYYNINDIGIGRTIRKFWAIKE